MTALATEQASRSHYSEILCCNRMGASTLAVLTLFRGSQFTCTVPIARLCFKELGISSLGKGVREAEQLILTPSPLRPQALVMPRATLRGGLELGRWTWQSGANFQSTND